MEEETEREKHTTVDQYKQLLMTRAVTVLTSLQGKSVAASILLLFMLLFTQWVVGQGMTSILSWVMGPLSGLRMVIMLLPDIVIGSRGGMVVEMNKVDLVMKKMNSDKMREVLGEGGRAKDGGDGDG